MRTKLLKFVLIFLSLNLNSGCEDAKQATGDEDQASKEESTGNEEKFELPEGLFRLSSASIRLETGEFALVSVKGDLIQQTSVFEDVYTIEQTGEAVLTYGDLVSVVGCSNSLSGSTRWQFKLDGKGLVTDGQQLETSCQSENNSGKSPSDFNIKPGSESYQILSGGYKRNVTLIVNETKIDYEYVFQKISSPVSQNPEGNDPVALSLHGIWHSSCLKADGGASLKYRWLIGGDFMELHYSVFSDAKCTNLLTKITEIFNAKATLSDDGDYYADLSRTAAKKKYADFGYGLVAIVESHWGINNWPLWQDVDITDRQKEEGKAPKYPKNERRYDRFRIEGERLYMGDREQEEADGSTEKKRPEKVLTQIFFEKYEGENKAPWIITDLNFETDVLSNENKGIQLYDLEGDDLKVSCSASCPEGFSIEDNSLRLNFSSPKVHNFYLTIKDQNENSITRNIKISVNKTFNVYEDKDGDGVGIGSLMTIKRPQNDLPLGYSYEGRSDCNDDDSSVWKLMGYSYRDLSGFAYIEQISGTICANGFLPEGYFNYGNVSSGYGHTCALLDTGAVKCWGSNSSGQIGDGNGGSSGDKSLTPVGVSGFASGVVSISSGDYHTCALLDSGEVKCWGSNSKGQLGDETTTSRDTPVSVTGLNSGVVGISSAGDHTCALLDSAEVKCWGLNDYGQLGDGTTTTRKTPVSVTGLSFGVVSISGGYWHTCALLDSGAVKCWGKNAYGQLGDETTDSRYTPVSVPGLSSGAIAISNGRSHTCAISDSGTVQCWGRNDYGQLGNGTTTDRSWPVSVSGLSSGVVSLSSRDAHTCALLNTGAVKCWGWNAYGQLGDGTTTNRLTPVSVIGLTSGVVSISSGDRYNCAVLDTGEVKCWGYNWAGQLGDGTTTRRLAPVSVSGLDLTP